MEWKLSSLRYQQEISHSAEKRRSKGSLLLREEDNSRLEGEYYYYYYNSLRLWSLKGMKR